MIELSYPSKHETLRVIRQMASKSLKLPFPETMVETPMPQSSSAALQGVETASRVGWVDGEQFAVSRLSPERQKVWRWMKGVKVTSNDPTPTEAEFMTDVSWETCKQAMRQYRAFHGIE